MKRLSSLALAVPLALTVAACPSARAPVAVAPPTTSAPVPVVEDQDHAPAALEAKPSPFPHVTKATLANGLRVSVVESHALPVVELRVVVHAGAGFGPPAVGEITGQMLKEGGTRAHTSREIVKRIETLGSNLGISTGPDATRIAMRVVTGQFDDALDILREVIRTPRFDAQELGKLKARMTDEAQEEARSNGTWCATHVLFAALYPAGSPYAEFGAVPAEIAKVGEAAIDAFYGRFFVPSNVEVIVAGDVEFDGVRDGLERNFGDWNASPRPHPPIAFPVPTAPAATRVVVVDRPKSVQSDVIVTQLLPDRHSASWPADRVALQVFGGGLTGRLFQDVREKRSLAYSASAHPLELAHDLQPLLAYAGTQAPKTADAVKAVLENLAGMRSAPPTADEVSSARRYLSDIFAVHMETIGAIADLVAELRELGLADDYWDTYRADLRAVTTTVVDREAGKVFDPDHALIVVAGDADLVAAPLTRFGDVAVVDPEHDFRVLRRLPKGPVLGAGGQP